MVDPFSSAIFPGYQILISVLLRQIDENSCEGDICLTYTVLAAKFVYLSPGSLNP